MKEIVYWWLDNATTVVLWYAVVYSVFATVCSVLGSKQKSWEDVIEESCLIIVGMVTVCAIGLVFPFVLLVPIFLFFSWCFDKIK